jgi:hypothetical protein
LGFVVTQQLLGGDLVPQCVTGTQEHDDRSEAYATRTRNPRPRLPSLAASPMLSRGRFGNDFVAVQ